MIDARRASRRSATNFVIEALEGRQLLSGTGLTREIWNNLPGQSLTALKSAITANVAPVEVSTLTGTMQTPASLGDNYGQRLRGYFIPTQSGAYTFYIDGDDAGELYLSTDATAANKVLIASFTGNTAANQWTKYASQKSVVLTLTAGQSYYIEALHKEAAGSDFFGIRVDPPGTTTSTPTSDALFTPFTDAPANAAPVVATSPKLTSWSAVYKANLTALGFDDQPESALKYTWSVLGTPAGASAVTFSANNANAAKNTAATLSVAGDYQFRLTITDAGGLTTTADFTVNRPVNATPTVATPAAAVVNTVTGKTASLSVLGADDGGEAALKYTWSTVTKSTGANNATFSVSGSNAAKNTIATFNRVGTYVLRATIVDGYGVTTTSDVTVVVNPILTSVQVTPNPFTIEVNRTSPLVAKAFDQFAVVLATQPTFTWSLDSGVGSIDVATGVYSSGLATGAAVIRATVGSVSGTATVTVTAALNDWYGQTFSDWGVVRLTRQYGSDGVLSRTDVLGILRDVEDGGAVDANEVTDLRGLTTAAAEPFTLTASVTYLEGKVASKSTAGMTVSDFEYNVGKYFLGTVAPVAMFNGRAFTYSLKTGTLYGPSGDPRVGDIDQGSTLGDCVFLATLGATFGHETDDSGNTTSAFIKNMIEDNGDGTYSFRYYLRNGPSSYDPLVANYVTVDKRIANLSAKTSGNILWVALAEKALAQAEEFNQLDQGSTLGGYDMIGNGASLSFGITVLTGKPIDGYLSSPSSLTFTELKSAFDAGKVLTVANTGTANTYAVNNHAYSIMNVYVDASNVQRVVVRNPWGVDGRTLVGLNDGFMDLTFAQFVTSFNYPVCVGSL